MHKIHFAFVLVIIFIAIFYNCRTRNKSQNIAKNSIYQSVQKDKSKTLKYNFDSTFVIILNIPENINTETLHYQILDIEKDEIIKEDQIRFGEIEWIDDYLVEIKQGKGIMEKMDQYKQTEKFNVIERRLIEKDESKK